MAIVIWNASAGKKMPGPGVTEESLHDLLDRHEIGGRIVATHSADAATAAVREAVEGGERTIVAAGGDGTFDQIATELVGSADVALGILPLGSVMNVARMIGVPRDLEAAADVIAAGRTRLIDVGKANGQTFFETASVGMNAAMFSVAQHFEDGDFGSPLRALVVALRYRPAHMFLELDDEQVTTRALMVTISNGAYMGVGMTVAPDARLDDGRFDVRVFRRYSKLELLRHLASIAFGRRRYVPDVRTYRAARVRVTSHSKLPTRADSHDLGSTPLECRCRHAALRVIVGPDFADGNAVPEGVAAG
jgi:YegS/Rv2252/BmrU family lipid kinase